MPFAAPELKGSGNIPNVQVVSTKVTVKGEPVLKHSVVILKDCGSLFGIMESTTIVTVQ